MLCHVPCVKQGCERCIPLGKVKLVGFLTGTRANFKSGFQSPRRGEHRIQADDKSRELPHWRVPNHPQLCHIHRCYQLHRERNSLH